MSIVVSIVKPHNFVIVNIIFISSYIFTCMSLGVFCASLINLRFEPIMFTISAIFSTSWF